MFSGVPCECWITNGILYLFNTSIVLGSYSNPETSLISLTPISIPLIIICDFLVSNDSGIFLLILVNTFLILFHSFLIPIDLDPGLVDSPPISTMFAPDLNKFIA